MSNTKGVINPSPASHGPLSGKQLALFAVSVGTTKELQPGLTAPYAGAYPSSPTHQLRTTAFFQTSGPKLPLPASMMGQAVLGLTCAAVGLVKLTRDGAIPKLYSLTSLPCLQGGPWGWNIVGERYGPCYTYFVDK